MQNRTLIVLVVPALHKSAHPWKYQTCVSRMPDSISHAAGWMLQLHAPEVIMQADVSDLPCFAAAEIRAGGACITLSSE